MDPRPSGSAVVTSTLGYGFTEPQVADEGPHHRLSDVIAGSASVLPWLGVGLAFSGRYDRHPSDDRGRDDGWMLSSALTTRAGVQQGEFRIGGELTGWLPGSEDPGSALGGLSLDSKVLFGWMPNTWSLATYAGYRLDRGGKTAEDPERLRAGDRLALGLSSYDAVLLGLGGIWRHQRTEVLAEVTGDLLVGSGAPPVRQSPWRVSSGVRQGLLPHLKAAVLLDVSLSARPAPDPVAPLVPIDPRWSVLAGIVYEIGGNAPPPAARSPFVPVPRKAAPTSVRLSIRVVDDQKNPLTGAKVTLYTNDRTIELVPDGNGNYVLENAPPGPARIRIEAPGFRATDRDVEVGAATPPMLDVAVERALPAGEVRGAVRSTDGKTRRATIRIEPLGKEITTDDAGNFSIEVPPGSYEVVIEAADTRPQRRRVQVQLNGVVILNVELSEL